MKTNLKISIMWALVLLFGCQKQNNQPATGLSHPAPADFDYQVYHGPAGKTDDVLPTDLFYNKVTDSIMNNMGLSAYPDSIIHYYTDSAKQAVVYTKRLSESSDNNTRLDLFMISSNNNLANVPVLAETKTLSNGNRQCTMSNFIGSGASIVVIVDSNGKVISVNGSPAQTSVGGSGGSQPCSQSTSNYKDCFKCSWGQLTDDAFGTLTCSLNPVMCLMACGISCAMFPVPPSGHDPYTYADIQAMAGTLISNGQYSGSISPLDKDFLFVY